MPEMLSVVPEDRNPLEPMTRSEASVEPLLLKQGIAVLAPVPLAQGGFGQVYLGKILNPLGLLAERIVWGEESPHWLGLGDIPYVPASPESPRLPSAILGPENRERVYAAATRLWREYRDRRQQDPVRADEEFKDWLNLIDPMLREERTIAVKVLQAPRTSDSSDAIKAEDVLRRFIKENELLRRLEHPGIVRRFGIVRDPQFGWCLLLEYIEGKTIEEHLSQFEGRRMPLPQAVRMIGELAQAVEYVQSKGIVHRDLKPQNIMVRRESGSAVIMDFGIGKWIDESPGEQLTMAGVRLGTPRYMAPEQALAAESGTTESKTTPLSDVYQLSTVLFEMVTGHAAYEGMEAETVFSWLLDPAKRHPSSVHEYLPGISQELEALIEVGREKDLKARWTISEFRTKIDHLIREGLFEKRRHRRHMPSADLRHALGEARIRRKEALWKEHVLERELGIAEVREQTQIVRGYLDAGDWASAEAELRALRSSGRPGELLSGRIAQELEVLEKALRLGKTSHEAGTLLTQAEAEYSAGRYSDVEPLLGRIAQSLIHLPRKSAPELHERYKKLSRVFDAQHRSFVELFAALRTFVEKIGTEYHRLHELYGAGQGIGEVRILEVLRKLDAARKNLGTIDAEKVGRAAHLSTQRELDELEIVLRDLGARLDGPRSSGGTG